MIQLTVEQRDLFQFGLGFALSRIDLIAEQLTVQDYPFYFATHNDGSLEPAARPLWGDGHWVGMLWLAYEATGNSKYLEWAKIWTAKIEFRKNDTWTHDLGWLLGLSHLKGYYIIQESHYLEVALEAAENYTKTLNIAYKLVSSVAKEKDLDKHLKNLDKIRVHETTNILELKERIASYFVEKERYAF